MKVRVTNIQRFSLQDGPGIRTTIFLKGCSLKCPWCSNPENIDFSIQEYNYNGKIGVYGYDIDLEKLYDEIIKDKKYFINNGGVTFSGGEALLQFDIIEPLLKKLKKNNINICVETCLVAPLKNLKIAIKYVDEFFVDIKLLDKKIFNKIIKGNYDLYKSNIDYLFKFFDNNKITFRMPIPSEYTFLEDNIKELEKFLSLYHANGIGNILNYTD